MFAAGLQDAATPLRPQRGSSKGCVASQEASNILGNASALLEQANYQAAAAMLQSPAESKCDYRFNLLLAASYEGLGDLQRAEHVLAAAHTTWPSNNSIAASLSREFMSTGRVNEAVKSLDHFHATAGTPAQELNAVTIAFLAGHRLSSAEEIAQLAYRSYPNVQSLLLLANTLQLEGRYKDVIALLDKQRTIYAQSPAFLITVAESEYDASIFDTARQDLRRAIELDANLYQAHYLLGNVLLKQGDADQAEAQYRLAISLADDQPRTYYQLALALRAKQDEAGEEQVLLKALAIDNHYAEAHAEMGRILLNQGRLPEAVNQLSSAVQENPALEQPYNLLARAYDRLGDLDKANAMTRQLAHIRSSKHEALQVQGEKKIDVDQGKDQ